MKRILIFGTSVALLTTSAWSQPAPTPPQQPQLTLDQQLDPIVAETTANIYKLRDIIRQGSDQNVQLKNGWMETNKRIADLTKERDDLKAQVEKLKLLSPGEQKSVAPPETPASK